MDGLSDQLRVAGGQLQSLGTAMLQLIVVAAVAYVVTRIVRSRLRYRLAGLPSPVFGVVVENTAVAMIYVIAVTVVLAFWGVTWSSLIAALSIGTIAIAFGFQDLLRCVVGGMLAVLERPFAVGDRIRVRDIEGKVEQIALRTTVIRADNGDRVTIPNSLILTDPVNNRSPNRISRVINISGIEGTPTELRRQAVEALSAIPDLEGEPAITIRTRQSRKKVHAAIHALPGIDLDRQPEPEPVGIGMKIIWTGDGTPATRGAIRKQLQTAFPDARIAKGTW